MQQQLTKVAASHNRARIALALQLMGSEAYMVEGVRSGAYDDARIRVDSEAWAMACMMLPRKA